MLPISVCMIAKNESKRIERCLSSLMPYGFEIVVADTGSSDNTMEIARRFTDKVFTFDWCDDFSAARNFSISKASFDWIFMIDCDEYIKTMDIEEFIYFMEHLSHAAGSVNRENVSGTSDTLDYYTDRTERLFNRNLYYYTGIIHEQLTPVSGGNMECFLLNTVLGHDGYVMTDEERERKSRRNLSLLLKQLEKEPDNPYVYYQLGKGFEMTGDYEKSCQYYEKGLSFPLDTSLAYVQAMVVANGFNLLRMGKAGQALAVCRCFCDDFANSADFLYLMGLIYRDNRLYEEALGEFAKAVTFEFANENGANSFLAYYEMGNILVLAEDYDLARQCYLQCGDYAPAQEILKLYENQ
ncbi:MAG: glycosyltransferase [Lachnospiraceae bacterium]|nr:glycosyltransferase [Lachnospiraceae bacterium]